MNKIKVGILGCGAIAERRHAPEYFANPSAEIAGFFDANPERAAYLTGLYGGRVYHSADEMLHDESIRAISVCTPNSTHAELSLAALDAGKHVLCEKPMGLSLEETGRMLAAERKTGHILMPGHNQRLIPAHMKSKQLLSSGAIGKPLFFQCNFKHSGPESWSIDHTGGTWFFNKSQARFGVFGDLGSHKIDLIRFLTGMEIDSVFASMMTLDKRYEDGRLIDLEDNVICQFRMENGMPGIMHFSWTNYGQEDNSTILYGDQGVMKIFGDYADDIVLELRDGTTVKYQVGSISTNQNQKKSGVIDEFVDAILLNRKPIVCAADGHNTLAVITAGLESSRTGSWVTVDYRKGQEKRSSYPLPAAICADA